ncbi:hypothetical protein [Roseateles sp.]|uniref:hypothetical protein n=1 Tax=Roseateles sp. TaxID=1971397 RepID=UPI0031D8ED1C
MKRRQVLGFGVIVAASLIVVFAKMAKDDSVVNLPDRGLSSSVVPVPANSASAVAPLKSSQEPNSALLPWAKALSRVRRESLQVTAQRAAVSGKLTDIVALRVAERACVTFQLGAETYAKQGIVLTPTQLEHFALRRSLCDAAGTPESFNIPLKDGQGLGVAADAVLSSVRGGFKKGDARREEAIETIVKSRSIELLDAVPRNVFTVEDAYRAGLPRSDSRMLDEQLMDMAIKIQACSVRGDCDIVALDRMNCSESNSCVSNMLDFPEKKIFAEPGDRVPPYHDPRLSSEDLRARWMVIQGFFSSRFDS